MANIRRTWDKEYYEKKAKERAEQSGTNADDSIVGRKLTKEEFTEAEENAAGPMGSNRAFLQSRQSKIDLNEKVGKVEVINPTIAESARGAGFWCEVCSCLLKDSASYLDHLNGKKHQRALGFSMRVERADVDSVRKRLDDLKRKISNGPGPPRPLPIDEYNSRLELQAMNKDTAKKKKKEFAVIKKKVLENDDEQLVDPELAEMLGFGGFSSSKK